MEETDLTGEVDLESPPACGAAEREPGQQQDTQYYMSPKGEISCRQHACVQPWLHEGIVQSNHTLVVQRTTERAW